MTAPRDSFPDGPLPLRTPADVLAVLPFCIGYQPQDSLVAVSVRREGSVRRLGLVARVDLADVLGSLDCVERLRRHLLQDGAQEVLLVFYGDRPSAAAIGEMRQIAQQWSAAGPPLLDVLMVGSDGWRSLRCDDVACCGADVHPLTPPDRSLVSAEMVLRGATTAVSREQRLRFVEPASPRRIHAVMRHAEMARATTDPDPAFRAWRRLTAAAAQGRREGGRRVDQPARLVGEVAGSLGWLWFRDLLLVDTVTGGGLTLAELQLELDGLGDLLGGALQPAPECLDAAGDVFAQLARGARGQVRADAVAALAWVQWYAGDLGFARDVARLALACRTDQSLARLVMRLAAEGVPPQWARPASVAASGPIRD